MTARAWHANFKRSSKDSRTADGIIFDSKSEMLRYRELRLMQRGKLISGLQCQVAFPLERDGVITVKIGRCVAKYTADFTYFENEKFIIEDHKGHLDSFSKFRIAVFEAIYGVTVLITKSK